jgi:hypothetical protein
MHDVHIFLFGDNGNSTLVLGIQLKCITWQLVLGIVGLILYHVPVVVIVRYVPVLSIRNVLSCNERKKKAKQEFELKRVGLGTYTPSDHYYLSLV